MRWNDSALQKTTKVGRQVIKCESLTSTFKEATVLGREADNYLEAGTRSKENHYPTSSFHILLSPIPPNRTIPQPPSSFTLHTLDSSSGNPI